MGSTGSRVTPQSNAYERFSDVDRKYTPMSRTDRDTVGGDDWDTRYFQTSNAFDINHDLRAGKKSRLSDPTVQAMDRNMLPTNKDMTVRRLVGETFFSSLIRGLPGMTSGETNELLKLVQFGRIRMSRDEINSLVDKVNSKLSGATFRDDGYMSTTYNLLLTDARFPERPVDLRMSIPKGTKGMFSPTGSESEFVIHRGSNHTIESIEYDFSAHRLVFNTKTVN